MVWIGTGCCIGTAILCRQIRWIVLTTRADMGVDLRYQNPALRGAITMGSVIYASPEIRGKGVITLFEGGVYDQVSAKWSAGRSLGQDRLASNT
jgi:hypothetical protein